MMATPKFWYYPDDDGSLEEIDFGESLQDIQEYEVIRRSDAQTADGYTYTAQVGSQFDVVIVLEHFGTPGALALERKFATFINHLRRGGVCDFARDPDKAWASVAVRPVSRGDGQFRSGGNGFVGWSASATVASGDEVVIESTDPDSRREINTVSSISADGADVTLGSSAIYSYQGDTLCRHRDFYPLLFLTADDASQPILSHDHRINYTFRARLRWSPRMATALWPSQSAGIRPSGNLNLRGTADADGDQKYTLGALVAGGLNVGNIPTGPIYDGFHTPTWSARRR